MAHKTYIALDVGEKRIGVAVADDIVKIAVPYSTVEVDGDEIRTIAELFAANEPAQIVVGYPRNQQGEPTAQTAFVEAFTERLHEAELPTVFQDESLTSVIAEDRLKTRHVPYEKGDIDAEAASIILQDYLEQL